MSLSQVATSQWGWGFHTLRGGINPGDLRFHLRSLGVAEISKDFKLGDHTISFPGAAGPRRHPEWQLAPRAGFMSSSKSAITQLGCSFHSVRGGIDPGDLCFRPRVVGIVEV